MSSTLKHMEQAQALAIQVHLAKEILRFPRRIREIIGMPKVLIEGDIRLRVTESYAAGRPVKGHYRLEMYGMEEPLQVIWIIEGTVFNHPVRSSITCRRSTSAAMKYPNRQKAVFHKVAATSSNPRKRRYGM